ncbi:MAG: hypothetical protein KME25_15620 [Symplocastrum torsivum CPER-KK1]|jgi:tetratricopeptide (TPR) repeat protein|uniref:Tetratricopeptide repeat protein n=1 Tax=Symplocastrum torsivum CPER-KK1 TaxID=450513 RepID=A0A951PKZ6_9CYAN|nr:hypothetical protein [Symplocastrum torsivum CPER-KK1]
MAQHTDALHSYRQALATYDQALQLAPNLVQCLNNKGTVLAKLCILHTQLEQYPEALHSYEQALATYDHALYLAPDDTYIHKNKGLVLHRLGFLQARRSLQVRLSENIEALKSWQGAVAAFSCYLTIVTGDEYIRNLRDLLQKFLDNL